MQQSVFYNTTTLQRPEGMRDWVSLDVLYLVSYDSYLQNEYAIQISNEIGFEWENSEEQVSILPSCSIVFDASVIYIENEQRFYK